MSISDKYTVTNGRNTFTVYTPPPPPGNALCMALTGMTETELARRILAGEYDALIGGDVHDGKPE